MSKFRAVLLDVDGTLVDSNDAHAMAWVEAMARGGYDVPYKKVRSAIGMGSDNLLPSTIGVEKESEEGKRLSEWWKEIFKESYLPKLKAFPKSRELLARMKEVGLKLVVASSSEPDMLQKLLDIVGAQGLVAETTSAGDAKRSKPDPDIIRAALENAGYPASKVVMLGDTPYDVQASTRAGVPIIAVRCGGWDDSQLKGAIATYEDPEDLLAHYDSSPLGDDNLHEPPAS